MQFIHPSPKGEVEPAKESYMLQSQKEQAADSQSQYGAVKSHFTLTMTYFRLEEWWWGGVFGFDFFFF